MATTQLHGRAMGSTLQIVAAGESAVTAPIMKWAATRVDELEQLWSRFLPDSEVSRINAHPGEYVMVSPETLELVRRALAARRASGGRFEPTLLGAMHANGYDRTFVSIDVPFGAQPDTAHFGFGEITIDADRVAVCVARGSGFDPGGIGKGLAADLVAEAMIERGAAGALVNLGGDIRCIGDGPADGSWIISVSDDQAGGHERVLELSEGGVATSTRCRRRWLRRTAQGVSPAHHLVDPGTGEPAEDAANLVTVVAARCADAEWIATAVAVEGALPSERSWLGGAAVLLTDHRGRYCEHGPVSRFVR